MINSEEMVHIFIKKNVFIICKIKKSSPPPLTATKNYHQPSWNALSPTKTSGSVRIPMHHLDQTSLF